MLPAAWRGKSTRANPVISAGYRAPVRIVSTTVTLTAMTNCFICGLLSCQMQQSEQAITEPDAREGRNYAPDTVDQKVPAHQVGRRQGPVLHPTQRQGNQRDDNQGVEDHRR